MRITSILQAATAFAFLMLLGMSAKGLELNCPFCSAASQTIRQEMLSMDIVAIATLEPDGRPDIDGNATFLIERVLRGAKVVPDLGKKVEAGYFGPGKSNKKFLLLGVDPKSLVWSTPLPLTDEGVKYVDAVLALKDDSLERLSFYQSYFEHADSLLARDSYDEFALAPYSDVVKLKSKMNREKLLSWIQDPQKSPDRKRLYYTMLGICGNKEDIALFESMLTSTESDKKAGLDALIAAYLMLKGEGGLDLVNKQFLTNSKANYPDVYSAVMALRFHGTESNVLPKEAVLKSMRHLLESPELADLVIPDLARWGDWSQVDRLTELFKSSTDETSWVRVPVVNYLRACPLPEAKDRLAELEKIDPKAVKRAKTFFPVPTPSSGAKGNDSSMLLPRKDANKTAMHSTHSDRFLVGNTALGLAWNRSHPKHAEAFFVDDSLGNATLYAASIPSDSTDNVARISGAIGSNSMAVFGVVAIGTVMLLVIMHALAFGRFQREWNQVQARVRIAKR